MDMSRSLLKVFNIFYPFVDFLYVLQLEEYDTKRYLKRLTYLIHKRNLQRRGELVYTTRIKITLLLALLLGIWFPFISPIIVGFVNFIVNPYFEYAKLKLQKKAANHFRTHNINTKVIAIAGSFGKTTVKNYIFELVRFNYRTQMIPGNINTPTGIAEWILNHYKPDIEVLIVEMDTYFIGEIKRSMAITPADISILTNIGDQHLERFGTKANLKKALLEVFKYSKKDAIKIENKKSNLDYALHVAGLLKIPDEFVEDAVSKLKKPDRRGDIKTMNGFEVVDDSYNISETTATAAIEGAQKYAKRKKKKLVVITAGIPELGEENKDGNLHLGCVLEERAEIIILLKSILYKEVEKGIKNKNKIHIAGDLTEAFGFLKNLDTHSYLVHLLPELNDLYYS